MSFSEQIDGEEDNPDPDSDGQADRESARQRIAWRQSPEYRRSRIFTASVDIFSVVAVFGLANLASQEAHIGFFSPHFTWRLEWPYFAVLILLLCVLVILRSSIISVHRGQFDDRMLLEGQAEVSNAEFRLAGTGNLDLAGLWAITQQRLDYYHNIATDQAKLSFRNAQIATAIGFLALAITMTLSLTARSTTGSIVSGTLGAIGAILAGYIGRTFIRTQEATADHLRSYFNQPLEFSRFLAAERLLDTIEGDARESAVKDVVKAIVKMPDA